MCALAFYLLNWFKRFHSDFPIRNMAVLSIGERNNENENHLLPSSDSDTWRQTRVTSPISHKMTCLTSANFAWWLCQKEPAATVLSMCWDRRDDDGAKLVRMLRTFIHLGSELLTWVRNAGTISTFLRDMSNFIEKFWKKNNFCTERGRSAHTNAVFAKFRGSGGDEGVDFFPNQYMFMLWVRQRDPQSLGSAQAV